MLCAIAGAGEVLLADVAGEGLVSRSDGPVDIVLVSVCSLDMAREEYFCSERACTTGATVLLAVTAEVVAFVCSTSVLRTRLLGCKALVADLALVHVVDVAVIRHRRVSNLDVLFQILLVGERQCTAPLIKTLWAA